MDRYELKTGKFGKYFHDKVENRDLPLIDVLDLLNDKTFLVSKRKLNQAYTESIKDIIGRETFKKKFIEKLGI